MQKRIKAGIIPILLAVIVFAACFCAFNSKAYAADYGDYLNTSVFIIKSQSDFEEFAAVYGASQRNFQGKTLALYSDVDMENLDFTLSRFNGTWEGNGHSVKNLKKPLFNTVGSGAAVKNLEVYFAGDSNCFLLTNMGTIENVGFFGTLYPSAANGVSTADNYNKAAIAITNSGSFKNCVNACEYICAGSETRLAGFAINNKGTIENCVFTGKFNFGNSQSLSCLAAGIAADNAGQIKNCTAALSYEVSENILSNIAPYAISANVGADSAGTVNNTSAFISSGALNFGFAGANDTVDNCFSVSATDGAPIVKYSASGAMINGSKSDLTSANLGENYYYGEYPINKGIFDGEGTASAPFLVSCPADLVKIRVSGIGGNYVYELKSDLDLFNAPYIEALDGFTYSGGKLNGRGFAIFNAGYTAVFENAIGIAGENVGFLQSHAESLSGGDSDGYNDFSYDFGRTEKEATAVVAAESLSGSGTETDPYLIFTEADLQALDGLHGFALLKNDILLNSQGSAKRKFAIADLKVSLNGNGRSIVGLFEPICETLSGRIENLTVRGYSDSSLLASVNAGVIGETRIMGTANIGAVGTNSGTVEKSEFYGEFGVAGFAETNAAGGKISDCENLGDGKGADTYAFCKINEGLVERSVNRGAVTYAFSSSENGRTESCVNYGVTNEALGEGIYSSIDFAKNSAVHDGIVVSGKLEYSDFMTTEIFEFYDFENIFGYPVGSNMPELRVNGVKYKTRLNGAFKAFPSLNDRYSESNAYSVESVQGAITTAATANSTFVWKFNGGELEPSADGIRYVKNVGKYELTATFAGNDEYFPETASFEFEMKKGLAPAEIVYADGIFGDITVAYNGRDNSPQIPTPENDAELRGYGYTQFSNAFSNGERETESFRDAGIYVQTVTASSDRYVNIEISRTITVKKAELKVSLGDITCRYSESPNFAAVRFDITDGLVGDDKDNNLSFSDIAEIRTEDFVCAYVVGDDVGNYAINYTGNTRNYELKVTEGKLTITPITMPLDEISFYGATETTVGRAEIEYTGEEIKLLATYPEGISATYINNDGNKNVSADGYTVFATLTGKNYYPLNLEVKLIITKAKLKVKAPDAAITYGEKLNTSGLSPSFDGFLGTDGLALIEGIRFVAAVYDGETELTEGNVYDAGDYIIKISADGALNNYEFLFEDGSYDINKAFLTAVYDNNTSANTDFKDLVKTYDEERVVREITYFNDGAAVVAYEVYKDGKINEGEILNAGDYEIRATATPTGAAAKNYAVTSYVCRVKINKKSTSLSFEKNKYSFDYSAENYAISERFIYTGNLPEGATAEFSCRNSDGRPSAATDAGTYIVRYDYKGSENYEGCFAEAELTINPKSISIVFDAVFDYDGSPKLPQIVEMSGVINNEIDGSDISFILYNSSGARVTTAVRAGDYQFAATINDGNYTTDGTRRDMKINKLKLNMEWGTVSFPYGTRGHTEIDGNIFEIGNNLVTRRNFMIDGIRFDVSVMLPSSNAATYEITADSVVAVDNYEFVLTGSANKVIITPRNLGLLWNFSGNEILTDRYTVAYRGISLTDGFRYSVLNLAQGESVENLELVKTIRGKDGDIFHAGEYILTVSLKNSVNYALDNVPLYVTVDKIPLYINVADEEIERGETFYGARITLNGTVGTDIGKAAGDLDGARINTVTTYTPASSVGSVHNVTVEAVFTDYIPEVLNIGRLTVVANLYPEYSLTDVIYRYSGQYITVVIEGVSPEVRVTYNNNTHREVGIYTVSATVTYPSGRQRTTTCRMEIIKATPTTEVNLHEALFTENRILDDNFINGKAYLNGSEVDGRFYFAEETLLERGTNSYAYRFEPDDGHNLNPTEGTFEIKSEAVDFRSFEFDKPEKITFSGEALDKVTVTDAVRMNLKPVLSGLKLYRNGYPVDYIELRQNEILTVEVKFGDESAFTVTWEVTYRDPDQTTEVVIDLNALDLTDLRISEKILYVKSGGGRLTLAEKYKNDYNLYIDGVTAEEFIFNGSEGEITLAIRTKRTNVAMYVTILSVAPEPVIDEGPAFNNRTLIFVIVGVVLGVAAVVTVVLIIWKKKHG